MNAALRDDECELEPIRFELPGAAWARLRSHLGPPGVNQQVWDASFAYLVSPTELAELVDHWRDDFELPRRLLELPSFQARALGQRLRFVHGRSRLPAPLPLLMLHGFSGSPLELGALAPLLADRGIDVVCPALPGFGSSCASASDFARACAVLMRALGYERYAVHGSDLGARLALELAAVDRARVAAAHVTHVAAYPSEAPSELAALTAGEKAQLARLTELHEELCFLLPRTPVEELAFALSRLDGVDSRCPRLREDLLSNLTLTLMLGEREARIASYRAMSLAPATPSDVPIAVHALPLGAPTLRRFADRTHRIVELHELAQGGPAPGVEQPESLADALTAFCERLR